MSLGYEFFERISLIRLINIPKLNTKYTLELLCQKYCCLYMYLFHIGGGGGGGGKPGFMSTSIPVSNNSMKMHFKTILITKLHLF